MDHQVEAHATRSKTKAKILDHWKQAFDTSQDFISILDLEHRIIALNPALAKALNCTPEEAEGKRCCQVVHGTQHPPSGCPHNFMLEDGQSHQAEIYDEKMNVWLMVNVTPLHDEQGHLIGSIHLARDITRLKQIEQALRESQDRYHQLSEATMEGVLLSQESTILVTNQVFADMVGDTTQNLEGSDLLDFVAHHDQSRLVEFMNTNQSEPQEFTFVRKDGTQFPIEAHTRMVTDQGKLICQTAIRDLTLFKRTQQERADYDRLQGVLEMAGTVCHELNQPLTAIYGYLGLLKRQLPSDDKLNTKMDHILKQMQRIDNITKKLMRITQYKTKRYAGGENIIDLDEASSE